MKVGIRQKVLLAILEKGSVAAMSSDAQSDTSAASLIVKSVKITVDNNFTVESNTDLLAIKHSILATEENGITVKEAGSVVLPAKETYEWVKLQGSEATIGMVLNKLETPEIISADENDDDNPEKHSKSRTIVKKIGTLKMSSKSGTKTQTRWEIDCYDPEDKVSINFDEKVDKIFAIPGQQLIDCLDNVKFAVLPKDPHHVLDSISMQVYEKGLYFAATDYQHCAIFKCPDTTEIGVNKPLLVSAILLDHAMKIINKDDKVTFLYSEEKDKVYITQPNLRIRLVCTEKQTIKAFPSLEGLLKKSYSALTECSRETMLGMLHNASFVNSGSALFVFLKDKATLTVKAISEDAKLKPNVRQCEMGAVSMDAKAIWGVSHLMAALSAIKATNIQLHLPENMGSLKITSKDIDNFYYFTMALKNHIYTSSVSE